MFCCIGGHSSIGRTTVCGTVSSLFKSGCPPLIVSYLNIDYFSYIDLDNISCMLCLHKYLSIFQYFTITR